MISRLLAAVVLAALPAAARAPKLPDAWDVLKRSLEAETSAYQGQVVVESYKAGVASAKELDVRAAGDGRYRREIKDADGETSQLVVSDGKKEWIYDRSRNKVWEGEPADAFLKQRGPDDEFELLSSNYDAALSSSAPVAGRAVWLVELRAKDGGRLERRLWIDKRRGLVLRSQLYLPNGQLATAMLFKEISFRKQGAKTLFSFKTPPGAAVVKRLEPDYMALDEAKAAAGLEPRTPAWLPSGFVFESLDVVPRGGRKILHFRFSDGVNVLSLFQCPPHVKLDFGGKDAKEVSLSVGSATTAWTPEGRVLAWASGKSRFLLVGPLTEETLARVAESVR